MPDTATTKPARKRRNIGDRPRGQTGRHAELDRIVDHRKDGTTVTAEAAIIERVRAGIPAREAASLIGVHRPTYYDWIRKGVRIRSRMLAGENIVDPDELRYMRFANTVDEAEAYAKATDLTRMAQLAAGQLPVEVHVVREVTDADGTVKRTTETRTERTLPDFKAVKWRLGVLHGMRERTEVSGPDGGPIPVEVSAQALAARFGRLVDVDAADVAAPDLASGGDGRTEPDLGPVELGGGVVAAPQGPPRTLEARARRLFAGGTFDPDAVPPPPDE